MEGGAENQKENESSSTTTTEQPNNTESQKNDGLPCENECGKTAEVECQQCDAKYCNECFDSCHQKPPAMRKHTKTALGHKESRQCSEHKKDLEMYCQTCEEPVCLMCMFGKHQGHKGIPIKQKVEESLQSLKTIRDQNQEQESKIKEQITRVDASIQALHKERSDSKSRINEICDALIQKINDHRTKSIQEVDSIQAPHETALNERKESLNSILSSVAEHLGKYQQTSESQDEQQVLALEKLLTASLKSSQSVEPVKDQQPLLTIKVGSGDFALPIVEDVNSATPAVEEKPADNSIQAQLQKATSKAVARKPMATKTTAANNSSEELQGKLNKLRTGIQQAGEYVSDRAPAPTKEPEENSTATRRERRGGTLSKPKPVEYITAIPLSYQPRGVAINPSSNEIYVCDYNGDKIHIYSPEASTTAPDPLSSFAAQNPYAIAVDYNNNVWISDYVNGSVSKFTSSGNNIVTIENKLANNPGQLASPRGITCDRYDNVYVCDENLGRVQVYDSNGRYVRTIGAKGSGSDQLNRPHDVKVEGDKLMVCDRDNNRIQIFSTISGKHLEQISGPGFSNGQLQNPESVLVDRKGRVVVGEYGGRKRVQWLNGKTGEFLGDWDDAGPGKLNWASSLVENEKGEVYVSDLNNKRLAKLKVNIP
eukprot:TRINITY_DN5113_c0_g1_i1.p1 TRINITY_DN5113_c0_g1~~TRINITY_DN5113_c0_g1_i1.p1  ORF type:complete len:654 (+),score=175.53 TRINITY_DN5113_c0_g1_i1:104-2065(+)